MNPPQPPNTAGQPFAMKNTTVYPPHPPAIAGRPFVMMNTQAVGVTGNNPGYPHNASARGIMNASHISQAIVVAGIEEEITQSGLMYELGKYAFDVSMPEDGTIVQVIERYGTTEFAFSPEQLVVYQAASDGAYGCFMVTKAGKYHKSFSFDYHPTSEMSMLYRGRKPVRKGTVFARTACVKENGGTSLSLNLITAIGSFDSVADDCVWISESAAKRMRFKMRVDSKFGCGTKTFPLNMYGDSKNYQPFAHLGEMVRDDGLLCATRDYDPSLTPILMSRDSVSSLDDYADNPTYIPMKNGRVVDIKVWRNHAVPCTMPDTMSAQFEMYYQGMRRYHETILDLYFQLVESHRRATGYHSNYPPLRPEFTRAVYDSMMFLDRWYPIGGHTQIPQDMRAPLRLEEGKVPLDEYTVTITVEHEMEPGRGYKIAGNAGDCTVTYVTDVRSGSGVIRY